MTQGRYSEALIQRVLDHVTESDAPLSARAISVQLDLHKQTIGDILRLLFGEGKLHRKVGASGTTGKPPYLYYKPFDEMSAPEIADVATEVEVPADASATAALKFRGKSAVRAAYVTVTGSTYGQGSCFTAGALTRHVTMRKFTPEAVYQAINKLEADGMIEHVGQLKGKPGRANKRYKVLVERDENLVPKRKSGRPARTKTVAMADKKVEALTGLTTDSIVQMLSRRDELKALDADLAQRRAAVSVELTQIENTLDAVRKRLG